MVRYIMSSSVPEGREHSAQKIIDGYFNELQKHGPGGMRSQCYADYDNGCEFVHIKSFKRESIANHHFKSFLFRNYIRQLEEISGMKPFFPGCNHNKLLNPYIEKIFSVCAGIQ